METSEDSAFDYHRMKAQLFDEMVGVVKGIFEERELRVVDLEKRAIEQNLTAEKRITDEMARLHKQLRTKDGEIQVTVRQLTIFNDRFGQQLRTATERVELLTTLTEGLTSRVDEELLQIRAVSQHEEEEFRKTHDMLINRLKKEEEKWSGWYMELKKTTGAHQKFLDDVLAAEKMVTDQIDSFTSKLLAVQKNIFSLKGVVDGQQKEMTRISGFQSSLERLHLRSTETTSKLHQLENFVEKYEPIYTYAQVSDVMFAVMDDKLRRRLQEIDKKMLGEYSEVTSSDRGVPNLRRKIITSVETINRIMLRNKPYEQLEANEEEEKMQNYYEKKLDQEVLQLNEKLSSELKSVSKMVVSKMDETTKQLMLELNEATEMIGFRLGKAEDKLEALLEEKKRRESAEQARSERREGRGTPERKPATAADNIGLGLKLDEITRRLRKTSRLMHRREPSDESSFTQRYEGVHKGNLAAELSNLSSTANCLIPDNMVEMRRKSLIDMRRTKIAPFKPEAKQ